MPISEPPPTHEAVVHDLRRLREKGLTRLEGLRLNALADAARVVTAGDAGAEHVVVETTLRRAIERFGGGPYGEAASLLFGLDQGTRAFSSRVRRELAAERLERSADTFRKRYEPTMLAEIATQVLGLCAEQHGRQSNLARERAHPAESGMAAEWLGRFESYYRMWSPINALGADLIAYRATQLETGRPWDRRFGTQGPDDQGDSQEEQAEGYVRFALHHYAHFKWELRQFEIGKGGLWLLSDSGAEQELADAVYRIGWYSPSNERDDSYLRSVIAETPDQELHGFLTRLAGDDIGRETHREWQEWAATCNCSWDVSQAGGSEWFPTAGRHVGIAESCHLHQLAAACGDYLSLVDHDWRNIADWYRLPDSVRRGVSDQKLYDRYGPSAGGEVGP